jgi:hypothetical protein
MVGGISGEFSSIPVTRTRYPDNEQRIATHSLRRKMARSQAERGAGVHVFSSQERAETIPRDWVVFLWGAAVEPLTLSLGRFI